MKERLKLMLKAFLKALRRESAQPSSSPNTHLDSQYNDLKKENLRLRQEIRTLKLENENLKIIPQQTHLEERVQEFADRLMESLGLENELRYSVRNQRLTHVRDGAEWPVYAPVLWSYIQYWLSRLISGEQMEKCLQEAKDYIKSGKNAEAYSECSRPEDSR